ncbi:MerR family transcriptional regulator [Corynebacterium nasicanis]|uniref:MerR family transcriptional regulator n=1 Tax=Corynebacterium nasicanis TaxID=1448267 RepID=A0ABW1QBN4_9CORY
MSAVRKPASAVPPRTSRTLSIGKVLEALREEFPDVTVSKIRFLESEGLITPQRTASGYRRFTGEDVERLRYILVTQRDNYLPLKVIREQLEAMDAGVVSVIDTEPIVSPETFRAPAVTRLTDGDIAAQTGVEVSFVAELLDAGLIRPDAAGFFTADDVLVVNTAHSLRDVGFDVRHLRSLRNTAQRQADLIGQVAGPVARRKGRQEGVDMGQQLTALVVSLHASLVKSALRDELA